IFQGANPDLDPTTGDSSTIGVLWSPRDFHRLNVSVTGWRLHIDNAVNLPNAQFIVDNEASYPGRIVRAPAAAGGIGEIVSVDGRYINFGSMQEEGIDGSIDCSFTTAAGEFIPGAAATYMTKFKGASAPGGADVDRLSHANPDGIFAPRLKANVSLGWNPDP